MVLHTATATEHCPNEVLPSASLRRMLHNLHIPQGRPLVLLNGSTHSSLGSLYAQVTPLLQDGLASWLVRRGAVAITGGTDAGIFAVLGQGFARYGQPAACLGVTVAQLVQPQPDGVALEPNHTHMLLSAGNHWGAETPLMYALAAAYDPCARAVTLVVGGGLNTLHELEFCAALGRRMLIIAGSGGIADALLATLGGQRHGDERLQRLAQVAEIYRINLDAPPEVLLVLLDALLLR
ncbi:MAG: hypothetical protein EI684_13510 [Candidatus Viridilinea halotolerans]|uniref:LSDAT prokaryote domain-containing protein n=1 Tax=Candidatus Viridilinea halotolerans TaxID=2491704 RepID=A0A426TXC1_9CHLR|nr:MAG: hypothetical protein EI684_13510 [Candidatus Viridilinea halotolerans]